MSLFNFGSGHNTGLSITTSFADTRYAHDDVHDAELGRSVRFHTPLQREFYLKRHPEMVGKLPPVADPNRIPTWDDASTVDGMPNLVKEYARLERESALLKDPVASVQRREPTRPSKPEPASSLYRSSTHEVGHLLVCFAANVPVARISIVPNGDRLGEVKHANPANDEDRLAIALAGEAAEIVAFGQARAAGLDVDRTLARQAAERLARKSGGDVDAIIDDMRERVINMLRGEEHTLRYMAYELVNKRQIDFEDIDIAIDRAFTRQGQAVAAKAAPTKGRVSRTYNMNNPKDLADWNAKQGRAPDADPIGFAPGYIARVNK